jgi:DNA-binding beta-propeller fold protein YncE
MKMWLAKFRPICNHHSYRRGKAQKMSGLCAGILSLFLSAGGSAPPATANSNDTESSQLTLANALSGDFCVRPALRREMGNETTPTGGDISPIRYVMDPYPTFNGIALDVENNRVVLSDENRKSVLVYPRSAGSNSAAITPERQQIMGPQTEIGYISGVELDPAKRELYAVNNDIEDRIVVFDYDSRGNIKPKRHLYVPHQSWGVSLNSSQDQIAISVQQLSMIGIYRREAAGLEAPLRIIKGPNTSMADPHGIRWDTVHREIAVANHGNYSVITPYSAYDATRSTTAFAAAGQFLEPSLTFFADSAQGDVKPLRTIRGPKTALNWPMGIDIDSTHNEIAVANNGDHSVLIFDRNGNGDIAPARRIQGKETGIDSPMGVAIDTANDELWVANYGDHTALVFPRTASGNVPPKRVIRNAPAGTPTGGFGNPYAVAYDSKREELLVPN